MYEAQFPAGTPVAVRQIVQRRGAAWQSEITGVIESWEERPTGSWYAHGKNDKLWLQRLTLRKMDGEITTVVIDDKTYLARLEATKA
jgi:hypothetical protein